jgi:hypothetical protein
VVEGVDVGQPLVKELLRLRALRRDGVMDGAEPGFEARRLGFARRVPVLGESRSGGEQ